MIGLFTGVPRSGKTYTLVRQIANKYCKKIGDTYYLKKDFVLISDIDGLLIDHYRLEDFLEIEQSEVENSEYAGQIQMSPGCPQCGSMLILKKGQYGEFYSCESFPNCKYTVNPSKLNQGAQIVNKLPSGPSNTKDIKNLFSESGFKKLREKFGDKRIVIVIDECQRYFHSRLYDREIFYAFEYHGHYGLDIYLIAHHITKISKDIANCLEFETRLISRRFAIPGFFSYVEKQGYDVVGRGTVPVKKEYFHLYKSQHFDQGDKVNKPFITYFLVASAFLIFAFYSFYNSFLKSWVFHEDEKPVSKISSDNSGSVLQSSPVVKLPQNKFKNRKINPAPDADLKSNSYLSAPTGWIYTPVDTVRYFSPEGEVILIPYEGELLPLNLYPKKTLVRYSSGRVIVYEMRKKQTKTNQTYKSLSFIGSGENKQTQDDIDT